jgi:hypothetical protein
MTLAAAPGRTRLTKRVWAEEQPSSGAISGAHSEVTQGPALPQYPCVSQDSDGVAEPTSLDDALLQRLGHVLVLPRAEGLRCP